MKSNIHIKLILTLLLFATVYISNAQTKNKSYIGIETILELFENTNDSLLSKKHTWTYTYTDNKQTRLYKLYEELTNNNMNVERVQNGGNCYFIKLNEENIYTPELLYDRVQKLDSIANKFGIKSTERLGYIVVR